jgi:hypothetical protein
MTAPDQCCSHVEKTLANQAPSTHDPERHFASVNCRTAKGLFDHFVGAAEQREWEVYAERLGGLEVDEELDFA